MTSLTYKSEDREALQVLADNYLKEYHPNAYGTRYSISKEKDPAGLWWLYINRFNTAD